MSGYSETINVQSALPITNLLSLHEVPCPRGLVERQRPLPIDSFAPYKAWVMVSGRSSEYKYLIVLITLHPSSHFLVLLYFQDEEGWVYNDKAFCTSTVYGDGSAEPLKSLVSETDPETLLGMFFAE